MSDISVQQDYLVKAIDATKNFRAIAIRTTNLVEEAHERHDTWSASSAALGRTLTGTILLAAAELTDDEELTVRIQGDGPVGGIVATGKADYTVKGYLGNAHVALPTTKAGKIDVGQAVGKGQLSVTKDLGLKEPFTGQSALISGEIAEDLTYYLAKSEQIPSSVGLAVFVNPNESIGAAGGFILQAMPGATEAQIATVEGRIKNLEQLSQQFLAGVTPEELVQKILGEDAKILETSPVAFACDCGKEKFGKIIATLARKDLVDMINEDHGAEANCKFCGNHYKFSEDDLQAMLAAK